MPIQANTYEVDRLIQKAFSDFMATQAIKPVIIYDNMGFNPANDAVPVVSTDVQVTGKSWILFQVLHADGDIAALGTRMNRHTGILGASIYFETNRGRIRSTSKIADQILDFYQTVDDPAGVLKFSPRKVTVGSDQKGWWQVNVLADFQYDIIR